jgi:hypothetical protein
MFNKIDIDLLCNFYLLQIMLAEKQAALEKLEWEANVSNTKVEELKSGCRFYGCPSFCPYEVV